VICSRWVIFLIRRDLKGGFFDLNLVY